MEIKNKNILITGGAGFIGSHLADRLKEDNKVSIYDNFSNVVIKKQSGKIKYFKENILDLETLKKKE